MIIEIKPAELAEAFQLWCEKRDMRFVEVEIKCVPQTKTVRVLVEAETEREDGDGATDRGDRG